MSPINRPAKQILPGQKGWTCIIQVIEKHPVLYKGIDYPPFQKRYQNFLLTDMQGTKIKAVLFDSDIDYFRKSLKLFLRYKISNADVVVSEERFQLPDYKFTWFIKNQTPVEPVQDPQPYPLPCVFNVCRFADLHKFAESDTSISVRGLIVHRFPIADITETKYAKDYLLVNQEEIPIVLRLWKDLLADYDPNIDSYNGHPVMVIIHNLQVRTFHGLSLASRPNIYILDNPPLAPELDLRNWYAQNHTKIKGWIRDRAYENNRNFFPLPPQEQLQDIESALETFKTRKTTWVKGTVRFSNPQFPLSYVLCSNCQKELNAGVDWTLHCTNCSMVSSMEVRLNFPVTLHGQTRSIPSTIKSPDTEKLIPFTPLQIKQLEDEGMTPLEEIRAAMNDTEVICFLKYYEKRANNGSIMRRYVILKTYIIAEVENIHDEGASSTQTATSNQQTTDDVQHPPSEKAPHIAHLTSLSTPPDMQHSTSTSSITKPQTSHQPTTKRSIQFGSLTDEDFEENPSKQAKVAKAPTEIPAKEKHGSEGKKD